jgi:SAM-dependent methyltransferase
VLELGCGGGNALPGLRRALEPELLVGVDLVTDVGVRGDVRALPFASGSFDVVVDFGTCQAVGPRAVREVLRVLRPGGVLAHETAWAQLIAHPTGGRRHLDGLTGLTRLRTAGLWELRVRG